MNRHGFALTEALVAVAIGGLVLTGLMALNIDYIALSRRAVELGEPNRLGGRLESVLAGAHRCDQPGGLIDQRDGKVVLLANALVSQDQASDFITLTPGPSGTAISGAGVAGTAPRAARAYLLHATQGDGAPRGGWSMAAIEAGDATIAVVALRCDLPEVCDYDTATGLCREQEEKRAPDVRGG